MPSTKTTPTASSITEKPILNSNLIPKTLINTRSTTVREIPASSLQEKDPIRVLGMNDHKKAAVTLAESFRTDEVAMYFLRTEDATHRSEEELWKLHVEIMEYMVAAICLDGLVLSIGENYEGIAMW